MSSSAILLGLALAALIAYVAQAAQTYHALKQFGGHWSAGWTRLWLLRTQSSGEMNRRFTDVNRTYGSTARVGPRLLITSDPQLMRRMNAVRSTFTRGPWYRALKLHPDRDNITSYTDEQKHADLRARMAPGYSGRENTHLEQDVDETLLQLFDLISKKYLTEPKSGKFPRADLASLSTYFTLDVISLVAFGEKLGFLERDEDPYGYLENLTQMLPAIILFGVYSELTRLLSIPLVKAAMPKSTDQRGLGRVMGFSVSAVRERFGDKPVVRSDMLGSFIAKGLTREELESETLTQITAGSDSTASAFRLALHYISAFPPILERLLGEFHAGVAAGKVSRPLIKDSEARQLPYLQACIKEVLRISPPVTGFLAKLVPKGGTMIKVDGVDKFAPEGTQIGWNSWGMMRDQNIFGPDTDIFRPERWLACDGSESERARVSNMTDTVSLCFGYGRFGCLGRGVATMELNKAIVETLHRFTFQACNMIKPFSEVFVGFTIHKGMHFVITERKSLPAQDLLFANGSGADAGAIAGSYES